MDGDTWQKTKTWVLDKSPWFIIVQHQLMKQHSPYFMAITSKERHTIWPLIAGLPYAYSLKNKQTFY